MFGFLLIVTIFFGFSLSKFIFKKHCNVIELIGLSFPIGMISVSFFSVLINSFIGFNSVNVIITVVLFSFLSIIFIYLNKNIKLQIKFPKLYVCILLLIYIGILSFFSFISYAKVNGKIVRTGENDCLLEFAFISSFVDGVNNKRGLLNGIKLPLFSENYAKSEYLPSIYEGLLNVCGIDKQISVFICTLLLLASIVLLHFVFALNISKNEYAAILSVPVLFLLGGFGFLDYQNASVRQNPIVDYVFFIDYDKINHWGHPFIHCILTSRVEQITIIISLITMNCLHFKQILISAIMVFICAIIRPQTAVALSLIYVFYSFDKILRKIIFIIPTLLYLFLINMKPWIKKPSWSYDIYMQSLIPPLKYPFMIFGLLFPSLIFALSKVYRYKTILSVILFYAFNFISLQWDPRYNFFTLDATIIPLMITLSLAGMVSFANYWKAPDLRGMFKAFILFIVILMCFSSSMGIYNNINQTYCIWNSIEYNTAKWISNNTDKESIFASPIFSNWNPAVVLSGRQLYNCIKVALHSTIYNELDHNEMINNFLTYSNLNINVDYFLVQKNDNWDKSLKSKPVNIVEQIYQNEKYIIYRYVQKNNQ